MSDDPVRDQMLRDNLAMIARRYQDQREKVAHHFYGLGIGDLLPLVPTEDRRCTFFCRDRHRCMGMTGHDVDKDRPTDHTFADPLPRPCPVSMCGFPGGHTGLHEDHLKALEPLPVPPPEIRVDIFGSWLYLNGGIGFSTDVHLERNAAGKASIVIGLSSNAVVERAEQVLGKAVLCSPCAKLAERVEFLAKRITRLEASQPLEPHRR